MVLVLTVPWLFPRRPSGRSRLVFFVLGGWGRVSGVPSWVRIVDRVFFFNRGVLRTCCEPWSMLDLTENRGEQTAEAQRSGDSRDDDVPAGFNVYAHLSNHCTEASTSTTSAGVRFAFSPLPATPTPLTPTPCVTGSRRGRRLPDTDWRRNARAPDFSLPPTPLPRTVPGRMIILPLDEIISMRHLAPPRWFGC